MNWKKIVGWLLVIPGMLALSLFSIVAACAVIIELPLAAVIVALVFTTIFGAHLLGWINIFED